MKYLLQLLLMLFFAGISMAQNNDTESDTKEPQFSMKTYYFVFLNSAPDRPQLDSAKAMEIQTGHRANIKKMHKEGKCILAGPFLDDTNMRGILIMDVNSEDEVIELLKNDPAISNGLLIAEIKPWYGPVGLNVTPD